MQVLVPGHRVTLDLAGIAHLKHLALVADRITCIVRPPDGSSPDDALAVELIEQRGPTQGEEPTDVGTSTGGTGSRDVGGGDAVVHRGTDAEERISADVGVPGGSVSMEECGTLERTQCGTPGDRRGTGCDEHSDEIGSQDAGISGEGPDMSSLEQPASEKTVPSRRGTRHGTQPGTGSRNQTGSDAVVASVPSDWLWSCLRPGVDMPWSFDMLSKAEPVGVLTGTPRDEEKLLEGVRVAAGWRYKFGHTHLLDLDAVPCELYDELERGCSF